MMVSHASLAAPLMQTSLEVARENRMWERTEALASIPAFNVAFNIDVGGNSLTVLMSDRVSGEIFRKLVYDQNGALQPQAASSGQLVNMMV